MRAGPLPLNDRLALDFIVRTFHRNGEGPSARALMRVLGFSSPRSATKVVERLERRGLVERVGDGIHRRPRPISRSCPKCGGTGVVS